jgi:hypothetical protein
MTRRRHPVGSPRNTEQGFEMKHATSTGTGKYEALLERCRGLAAVPTAVAYPCEASALTGAVEAAQNRLIVPILVGPAGKVAETAGSAGADLGGQEVVDVPDAYARRSQT